MTRSIVLILILAAGVGCQSSSRPPAISTAIEPTKPATRPSASLESIQPPTGRHCRVYLRRDALGMAGASALGPTVDGPMNRATVVTGAIDQVSNEWVVLKSDAGVEWIPRGMILLVEVLDR